MQVKSVRGSEESSSKVTGLEGKPLRKVLLKILVLLPFSLFVVILPVSFFFSLFYFTRGYTTEHTEFDMTTVSFVTDAICCGLLFFFQSVLLGCVSFDLSFRSEIKSRRFYCSYSQHSGAINPTERVSLTACCS